MTSQGTFTLAFAFAASIGCGRASAGERQERGEGQEAQQAGNLP